jgi:hypothetical protein
MDQPTICKNGQCINKEGIEILKSKFCSDYFKLLGGYECFCDKGFQLDKNKCIDINECLDPKNCINGKCTNKEGKKTET